MIIEGVLHTSRMDRPNTELKSIQSAQEHITNDDPFSKYWESSGRPGPARPAFWEAPSSDVFMPEVVPHLQHHNIQSVIVDPLCFSNVPGAIYSSQPSDDLAPWFISEPISCSLMVGDLDNPIPSLSLPPLLDYQQVEEELTEVTSMNSQPAVASVHGGELAPNFCEPGTVFLTLDPPIILEDDDPNMAKDVNVSGFSNQLTQYNQRAGPSNGSRDQTVSIYPEAYLTGAAEQTYESRLKKPCHCTRSLCLKLYCECFSNGVICTNCDCSNCHNNAEHEPERSKAVKSILVRNPDAFKPKFASGNSGEVKSWHNKGCNCKRSYCLKNYCECFEANILCCPSCKCVECKNSDCPKRTYMVVTPAVVEAVCDRLLTQAEKAEKETQSSAEAECMVLNEFGSCLTEIVKAMFKTKKSAY